ncbi:MAG: peptidoglycan-binding protein LysM [Paracoccaceae bacterium]
MGLWSFVKGAGKSVLGKSDPKKEDLLAEIEELGLQAEGLDIELDGDTVKVGGTAVSQEMKEKVILAVGNVKGIGAVEDNVAGSEPVFHTVEKGDTLWAVAKKTLGDGNRYMEIFDANKPMLSHPDKIYPGQMLRIPTSGTGA